VESIKNPETFKKVGAIPPKGIIFSGPPGIGKTHLAKAIANESQCNLYYKSASEFEEIFVGMGAKKIKDFFEEVRKNTPAIIFIDEIDSIGSKRTATQASHSR
jgi:ATP-dependent metalloprotease